VLNVVHTKEVWGYPRFSMRKVNGSRLAHSSKKRNVLSADSGVKPSG